LARLPACSSCRDIVRDEALPEPEASGRCPPAAWTIASHPRRGRVVLRIKNVVTFGNVNRMT
jgi:hypothetical protein